MIKIFKLLDASGTTINSYKPGTLGGNRNSKIYGKLDCSAANSALDKGYAKHRVFFADESTAMVAGYRPCGSCLRESYLDWKEKIAAIADKQSYIDALLSLRNGKHLRNTKFLEMLRAQYACPHHTITMSQLAKAVAYQNFNAANLQYGLLAHRLAEYIGYTPSLGRDGEPMWWSTLSLGNEASETTIDGHFELIMRPELVDALEEMKWVKKNDLNSSDL